MTSYSRRLLLRGAAAISVAPAVSLPAWAQTPRLERVIISVPGPGNLLFLPITLASSLGLDKDAGFELDIRYVGGGPLAFRAMQERNSDFSAGGLAALALQKINGNPVVCIAPITRVPAYTLMVRSSLKSKVRQISDLNGMVLGVKGYSPGGRSTSQLFTEFVLQKAGVAVDRVNFVSVGQTFDNQKAALATGTVDALMGDEPFATRLIKEKTGFALADFHDLSVTRKQLGGLFLNGHVATRDDMVANRPQTVEKMVQVMQASLVWVAKHSAQEMVEALKISDAQERTNMLDVLKLRKNIYVPDGRFSDEQVATTERFFHATESSTIAQEFRFKSIVNARWAGSVA